jgi:hypothetical protein
MGKGAGDNHPPPFEKLRAAKLIYPPFFFALNLRAKNPFLLLWYGNIYWQVIHFSFGY